MVPTLSKLTPLRERAFELLEPHSDLALRGPPALLADAGRVALGTVLRGVRKPLEWGHKPRRALMAQPASSGACLRTVAERVPSCNHSNDQPRQWP